MPARIRFRVGHRWAEDRVAWRLTLIVNGDHGTDRNQPGGVPCRVPGSDAWQLDTGNDWRMSRVGEREYELRHRYGKQATLDGLVPFLEGVFGFVEAWERTES